MSHNHAPGKNGESPVPKRDRRYQVDAAYRRVVQTLARERYHKDPAYHRATLERARRRYHEDPEYRLATIERAKRRYRRLKAVA